MIRLGIIGYPLGHSLSPQLHQNLLAQAGLSGRYEKYEIPSERFLHDLPVLVKQEGLQGFNVTIPHKSAIIPLLSTVDPIAKAIQAVNTVTIQPNGDWHGTNTDIQGFLKGFPMEGPPIQRVLILGAGGAARAVGMGLIQAGATQVYLHARNLQKSQETLALFAQTAHNTTFSVLDSLTPHHMVNLDWVINTTPLGMAGKYLEESPLPLTLLKALPASSGLYDLVYRPLETHWLAMGRQQGLITQNGLPMLIEQGIASFEQWTGCYREWDRESLQRALDIARLGRQS